MKAGGWKHIHCHTVVANCDFDKKGATVAFTLCISNNDNSKLLL